MHVPHTTSQGSVNAHLQITVESPDQTFAPPVCVLFIPNLRIIGVCDVGTLCGPLSLVLLSLFTASLLSYQVMAEVK